MQEHAHLNRYTKKNSTYHTQPIAVLEQIQTIVRACARVSMITISMTRHKGGSLMLTAPHHQNIIDVMQILHHSTLFASVSMSHLKKLSTNNVQATLVWHEQKSKKSNKDQ